MEGREAEFPISAVSVSERERLIRLGLILKAPKLITEFNASKSHMSSLGKVTVIIPALNEEKNIAPVLSNLKNEGYYNILVIDGKSEDKTALIASRNGVKVVLQNGKGKGSAIRQGLSNGYHDTNVVVMMDADGSMDPKEIGRYVEALNSGADIAKGSRFMKGGYSHDISLLRRIGNMFMVVAVNLLWSAKYTDLCYGFVAFNKKAIEKLLPELKARHFEIETEIFLKALDLGLVVKEVPSTEYIRKNGQSNLNSFRDGFKIFKKIIEEFVTTRVNSASKRG